MSITLPSPPTLTSSDVTYTVKKDVFTSYTELAELAQAEAANAQSTADGKITTFYQDSEPTSAESFYGDLWIDTDDDNKLYRYQAAADDGSDGGESGNAWYICRDDGIQAAAAAAAAAQTTADGKIETYFQTTPPDHSILSDGDFWVDSSTSTQNMFRYTENHTGTIPGYYWTGSAWSAYDEEHVVSSQDCLIDVDDIKIYQYKTDVTVSDDPKLGEYDSLADAISALSTFGGTIRIKEGDYSGTVTSSITLPNKDFKILGETKGKIKIPWVIASGTPNGLIYSTGYTARLEIENIDFEIEADTGNTDTLPSVIEMQGASSNYNESVVDIHDCSFSYVTTGTNYGDAIRLANIDTNKLNNNTFNDCNNAIKYYDQWGGSAITSYDTTLFEAYQNIINDSEVGIYINKTLSNFVNFNKVTIRNNQFLEINECAVFLRASSDIAVEDNTNISTITTRSSTILFSIRAEYVLATDKTVTFSGNTVTLTSSIYIIGCTIYSIQFESAIVKNNTISLSVDTSATANTTYGIIVTDAAQVRVVSNIIKIDSTTAISSGNINVIGITCSSQAILTGNVVECTNIYTGSGASAISTSGIRSGLKSQMTNNIVDLTTTVTTISGLYQRALQCSATSPANGDFLITNNTTTNVISGTVTVQTQDESVTITSATGGSNIITNNNFTNATGTWLNVVGTGNTTTPNIFQ